MNRNIAVVCVLGVAMSLVSGCSSLMGKNNLTSNGSLSSESMSITARPREFGLQMIGDCEGVATTEKFLFFTIKGDKAPNLRMPVYGNKSKGALETLACYRAAKSNGGDAFYSITTEWNKENVLFIYRKYRVKVKGKSLKLTDLGDLSEKRADGMSPVEIDFSVKNVTL